MGVNPVFEVSWERKGVIAPGLPILPHGTERHPVPGGGSRAVALSKGDVISVLDREGLQPGEIVFFAPDRRSDAAMLGARDGPRPQSQRLPTGRHRGKRYSKHWMRPNLTSERVMQSGCFKRGLTPEIWKISRHYVMGCSLSPLPVARCSRKHKMPLPS